MDSSLDPLADGDYTALAQFRFQLRRFLHFSDQAARDAGLEPQQHQLLLAIRGLSDGGSASIGLVAEWLQVRHHSAVELVDRAVSRGLVERLGDTRDRRRILVRLTTGGEAVLRDLSLAHRHELRSTAPMLLASLSALLADSRAAALSGPTPSDPEEEA